MNCACIVQMNKALEEEGLMLCLRKHFTFVLSGDQMRQVAMFTTKRLDGTKKASPPLLARFCPFCGKRGMPKGKKGGQA